MDYQIWKDKLGFRDDEIDDINDSFAHPLKFGTAGLRGVIGIGTNRMNEYVIARAAKAISLQLKKHLKKSIVISYDSRDYSYEFARLSAEVFSYNGIKVYITEQLMPTPLLSYAVRQLSAGGGVMVTASHNPKNYNGYKVYDSNGCQISGEYADEIWTLLNSLDYFDVNKSNFDTQLKKGNIEFLDKSVILGYIDAVKSQGLTECENLKICYTPLNGAGYEIVPKLLRDKKAEVYNVPEQSFPDGNFETCPYPNPEKREAFDLAVKYAFKDSCDIIIANDPDADRIGAMYLDGTDYILLSGDEIGLLITNYLLKNNNPFQSGSIIVRSIVTMTLCDRIASYYGVKTVESFTGFKNICGEAIKLLDKGEEDKFILGYEESNGIAVSTYAFDKDGVCAAMLLAEIAAAYKSDGKTLKDALKEIYDKFGFLTSKLIAIKKQGVEGKIEIDNIMKKARAYNKDSIYGYKILQKKDYLSLNEGDMPKADVVIFHLENDVRLALRPSGTEPLLKIYLQAGEGFEQIFASLERFIEEMV